MNLAILRRRADLLTARYEEVKASADREAKEANRLSKLINDTAEAQKVVQGVAADIQARVHREIAGVVSRCLEIFDDPYEFVLEFEQKRGKTEAVPYFLRDGHRVDPMLSASRGMARVAAFALRIANLILSQPARRRFVVLDEPFHAVHPERRVLLRRMLEDMAEHLDAQFLIVTNHPELKTGKVVDLS